MMMREKRYEFSAPASTYEWQHFTFQKPVFWNDSLQDPYKNERKCSSVFDRRKPQVKEKGRTFG